MTKRILSFAVLMFFTSCVAHACKCVGPTGYDLVFEGTVESIKAQQQYIKTDHYYAVRFVVDKTLKGETVKTTTVFTGSSLLCGATYEIGKRYTVYAINKEYLETKYCYGRETKK